MRILFVNELAGYFGGVEQAVDLAARALAARGHDVALAYGRTARDAEAYRSAFVSHHPCQGLGSGASDACDLAGILEQVEPDVLFVHKAPDAVLEDPVLRRRPTVLMVHDHDYCCPRRHKYMALTGRQCHHAAGWRCYLDGAFVRRDQSTRTGLAWQSVAARLRVMRGLWSLDRFVVGSRFMHDELAMNGCDPGRIVCVPPALTRRDSAACSRVLPPPLPDAPNVLYVGQLIRGKGVDLLLRALARLARAGVAFRVRVVGDGNHRQKLERFRDRLGLSDRVAFEGWVAPDAIQPVYAWAQVVVVPSRWPEPFGMVGLEAMEHARPVVGFAVGGIPDWLEHGVTGRLAPAGDTRALARALGELLADPEQVRAMGQNGYARVQTRFTTERVIDRLEQVFRDVVHARRNAGEIERQTISYETTRRGMTRCGLQ